MKQNTERRTGRWSDRPAQTELVSPYADKRPEPRIPRSTDHITGPGPYESSYQISRGYAHERSIHIPDRV